MSYEKAKEVITNLFLWWWSHSAPNLSYEEGKNALEWDRERGLNQFNLPPENLPIEIAVLGAKARNEYLKQLKEEGQDRLYEAKLLIVGEPGAGKTSLARKLRNPQAKLPRLDESTRGIDIEPWQFPRPLSAEQPDMEKLFQANLWDFAGQEIYHATHRFFLTTRSLYVLVADTRQEDTDFFYWLNLVELLGGNSPVLIIKNEKDDRPRGLNERQLRERFTNLRGVFATNLADGRGLAEIRDQIQFELTRLPQIGDPLPKSWVNIRQALEADERNYIDWREYLALCGQHGIQEQGYKETLSIYLHELGICLHYRDDPLLRKTVFLKPEWCTKAVYKLLDTRQITLNRGRFSRTELNEVGWRQSMI